MHIGLETSAAASPHAGGIYRYIVELGNALRAREDMTFTLWYRLSRLKARRHWWRPRNVRIHTYHGAWWPPVRRPQLIHGLDGTLPQWRGIPSVATVHDLAVLSPTAAEFSDTSFREAKLARYRDLIRRADRLIAVSEATRRDLVEVLAAAPEHISVIPHGVGASFKPLEAAAVNRVLSQLGLRPGYLLYVGAVTERKNTARMVQAYAASGLASEHPLVLAGRVYHRSRAALEAISALKLEDRVLLPGPVHDADLPALYNGAAALVFPTLYEGFGLPVLEAMACGTPVLCADHGGAAEVAREFAVKVDPRSVEAIADGMRRASAMPEQGRAAARRHASRYTWQACAERTVTVYRELL